MSGDFTLEERRGLRGSLRSCIRQSEAMGDEEGSRSLRDDWGRILLGEPPDPVSPDPKYDISRVATSISRGEPVPNDVLERHPEIPEVLQMIKEFGLEALDEKEWSVTRNEESANLTESERVAMIRRQHLFDTWLTLREVKDAILGILSDDDDDDDD